MTLKTLKSFAAVTALGVPLMLCFFALNGAVFAQTVTTKSATVEEIAAFFKGKQKAVLTFVGYSGAGYEDEAWMLKEAERVLREYDPAKTIVNIGATPEGIGAVYELAKRKGFLTTGIVSSQARQYNVKLSPYVDYALYVEDSAWGGLVPGTEELSRPRKQWLRTATSLLASVVERWPAMSFWPQDVQERRSISFQRT